MVELINKCLKEPEENAELFYFIEDAMLHLDEANEKVTANFPLFFAVHLAHFFGFKISDNYSDENRYLDLLEGVFVPEAPQHGNYLHDKEAEVTAHLLKILQPQDLVELSLKGEFRRGLLSAYESYYALHIPEFGTMKTLPVLREILS
jgi:DNA repair protein RecO (recombination protein O)